MVEKPSNQDFSQALPNILNVPGLEQIYEQFMDASFNFSRNITLVMPPGKTLNSSSTYNPLTEGQDRRLNQSSDFGDKGYTVTPITVIYKAHIRHGPAPLDRENAFAMNENDCYTTTDYNSITDLQNCVEAIIDGKKFRMTKGPRPIGFSLTKYVITMWTRVLDAK